ncbi:hypothetical protein SNEBB_000023 [Seison nebaliae]|nr:hypothetical protein SNEBB_000023 [Seison nebaliae]
MFNLTHRSPGIFLDEAVAKKIKTVRLVNDFYPFTTKNILHLYSLQRDADFVLGQCIDFKNGVLKLDGPLLLIPITYDGWLEIISYEGSPIKPLTSINELLKKLKQLSGNEITRRRLVTRFRNNREKEQDELHSHLSPNDVYAMQTPITENNQDEKFEVSKSFILRKRLKTLTKSKNKFHQVVLEPGHFLTIVSESPYTIPSNEKQFIKCISNKNYENYYIGLNDKTELSLVASSLNLSGIHKLKDLLTKVTLPTPVNLVFGRPPSFYENFTSTLLLHTCFTEDDVLAISLERDIKYQLLPLSSDCKIGVQPAKNPPRQYIQNVRRRFEVIGSTMGNLMLVRPNISPQLYRQLQSNRLQTSFAAQKQSEVNNGNIFSRLKQKYYNDLTTTTNSIANLLQDLAIRNFKVSESVQSSQEDNTCNNMEAYSWKERPADAQTDDSQIEAIYDYVRTRNMDKKMKHQIERKDNIKILDVDDVAESQLYDCVPDLTKYPPKPQNLMISNSPSKYQEQSENTNSTNQTEQTLTGEYSVNKNQEKTKQKKKYYDMNSGESIEVDSFVERILNPEAKVYDTFNERNLMEAFSKISAELIQPKEIYDNITVERASNSFLFDERQQNSKTQLCPPKNQQRTRSKSREKFPRIW